MIKIEEKAFIDPFPIEFGVLKTVFIPQLKAFILQKEALKQQGNKNEAAFESEFRDFFKNTFYAHCYIGKRPYKKGEADLIIAENRNPTNHTSVLIEVKSPLDRKDFISIDDLNRKAFHQVVTYFLTEIIERTNFYIKHILITDTDDFFLFDANDFHQLFYKSSLKKDFENWYQKLQSGTSITDFYQQVEDFIAYQDDFEIPCTYVNLADISLLDEIEEALQENDIEEFNNKDRFARVKRLFHFFSPNLFLNEKAERDGNDLNYRFYFELLHILGLQEYQKNGLTLIDRLPPKERNLGSFVENAIEKVRFERPLHLQKLDDTRFDEQENDFEIALELSIIWINRILFLKLLEGQLQSYHQDKRAFRLLSPDAMANGNRLSTLFFHVLNTPTDRRSTSLSSDFEEIPYLNSGLFQISYVEIMHGRISGLRDDVLMPIYANTVLTQVPKHLPPLTYLLKFLDAYNFGEIEKQEVQHKTKDLINASVLGKIFEKLNGYKDGSFYTPSYITMYASKKVVRKAIVNKFNEKFGLKATDFEEIRQLTTSKYKTEDIKTFNQAIDEISVCDPAVGSGHFLVSVMNELIAAKSDLEILYDDENMPLQYWVRVDNDELRLLHKRIPNERFEYKVHYQSGIRRISKELQTVQMTIFREKQRIIESNLYGVDINPNSVQICRLRLWIELLKNAYYTQESNYKTLQTLPNLEFKIVEGNSLLPSYESQPVIIDWKRKYADNIRSISSKIAIINKSIETIKRCKQDFFMVKGGNQKQHLAIELNRAKADLLIAKFEIELIQIEDILRTLDAEQRLDKQLSKKEIKQRQDLLDKKDLLLKIRRQIDYSPDLGKPIVLFDWHIDFPEIIATFQNGNGNGQYHGFDIVIGNPPYIQNKRLAHLSDFLRQLYVTFSGIADISVCFFEKGLDLLKEGGQLAFINSNKFCIAEYGAGLRKMLANYYKEEIVNMEQVPVFDEALVSSALFHIEKRQDDAAIKYSEFYKEKVNPEIFDKEILKRRTTYAQDYLTDSYWIFNKPEEDALVAKIKLAGSPLADIKSIKIRMGIKTGYDDAFVIDEATYFQLISNPKNKEILKPLLRGKDIHKYQYNFNKFWLINSHNGSPNKLERIDIEMDYPQIYQYLIDVDNQTEEHRVKNRSDKGKHWTNLRSCAFLDDFDKEKIVWGLISGIWGFAYDDKAHFLTSASGFLISETIPLKFLLALFNSQLFHFYFDKTGEYTAGGAYVLKKINIEKFIIPTQAMDYQPFVDLVDSIMQGKSQQIDTKTLEQELNTKIYQLYQINEEERKMIEKTLIQRKIK